MDPGIREATESGILAGYPVVDLRIALVDGSYHEVDSTEMAFKIAGSMASKAALAQGRGDPGADHEGRGPHLAEEYLGDVMGDPPARRGAHPGHGAAW